MKNLIIKEIQSKTILSSSKVFPYVINPYVGCSHGCSYCYARFMKKFSGHKEPWGEFVDVKINAPELLKKEIFKKKKAKVWVSGVCDPYQHLEKKYNLTRQCLKILTENNWPVSIQTRSPLVVRDIDIMNEHVCVTISIPTADDNIRQIFEPRAPPIQDRIDALLQLHKAHIKTTVMIAPILPGAEKLMKLLEGKVNNVLVDKMNYNYADYIYVKYGFDKTDGHFSSTSKQIKKECDKLAIPCKIVF